MREQTVTLSLCILLCNGFAQAQDRTVDPATGAVTWATSVHGVTLSLTQLLPDQVRAFYLNRGLSAEATELYAGSCVYMTVLRNDDAPGVVHFKLADWSAVTQEASKPPLSVEGWLKRFEAYELQPLPSDGLNFRPNTPTSPVVIGIRECLPPAFLPVVNLIWWPAGMWRDKPIRAY